MRKNILIGIVLLLLVGVLVIGGCVEQSAIDFENIPPEKYCKEDSDCVPAQCCHATDVVNKDYAPDCKNIDCTDDCRGPLDCLCGKTICENNECKIKKLSSEAWCP
ncbi:hypothetical protein HQ529_05945 [Candidatus Woesearchaeota archaeon]|nr:hypothetical protein [Candidatus Woesearchaeota archaeon]